MNIDFLSTSSTTDANNDSSPSDDTDIEVTSTIDKEEYELVQISKNLCLDSDNTIDDDIF